MSNTSIDEKSDGKGRLAGLPDVLIRRGAPSPGRPTVLDADKLSPNTERRALSPGRALPRGFGGTVGKKDLEKLTAQERQRQEVIFEIIDTERQYVADVKLLVDKLLHPAIEKGVLSREDAGHLCLNIERLLELNTDLLKDLDALQAKDIIVPGIGPTLLTRCDHFKLYAVYCAHYKQANYEELRARLPKFGAFVDEVLRGEDWRGVPLTAYLHKPIARICKYPLLLRELLKHTPETLPDHAPLSEAYSRICAVVDRINERTRQVEAMQKLDEIEKTLEGAKDLMLAQLTRRFVKETNCKDSKKDDMHLFLFNDLILLTKPRHKKTKFEVKKSAPLSSPSLSCIDAIGDAKAIEISWHDGTKDIYEFATAEERNAWRTEMQQLIQACREEAKKKPAAQVASGTDRPSGRGKLTRTSSDSHIKNQMLNKSPSVPQESAKDKLDGSKDAKQKVPTLMVGTPTLISVSGNDATQPRMEAPLSAGRARHLIDLTVMSGRSAESPRNRRSTVTESPRRNKDYNAMSREELLKEVQLLAADREMMQLSMVQLKADMARVASGLKDEVTALREKLAAAEKERDELKAHTKK